MSGRVAFLVPSLIALAVFLQVSGARADGWTPGGWVHDDKPTDETQREHQGDVPTPTPSPQPVTLNNPALKSPWKMIYDLAFGAQTDQAASFLQFRLGLRRMHGDYQDRCLLGHDWIWTTSMDAQARPIQWSAGGTDGGPLQPLPEAKLSFHPLDLTQIDCKSDEPLDEMKASSFGILPMHVLRDVAIDDALEFVVAPIGGSMALSGSDSGQPIPLKSLQAYTRIFMDVYGMRLQLDTRTDDRHYFNSYGLHYLSDGIEEELRYRYSNDCSVKLGAYVEHELQAGTTGVVNDLDARARLSKECVPNAPSTMPDPKSTRTELYLEGEWHGVSDQDKGDVSYGTVMIGYEKRH